MSKSATKAPRAGIGRGGNRGISTILLARPDSIRAFVADLDTDRVRTGFGPGPDRVRLVPRDPRTPSVSGSASRRPSRGRTWRPGRIVPGRTRLRGRQNRAIMRKPTDTPGAVARTILPGRQNRVRALGPARPRPRRGAPVQQIRTHPAPQAPYAPLRHTQNNLPGARSGGVCPNLPQRPGSSRNTGRESLGFRAFLRRQFRPGAPLWQIWTRPHSGPIPEIPRVSRAPSRSAPAGLHGREDGSRANRPSQ